MGMITPPPPHQDQRVQKRVCTSNRPHISGPFNNVHLFPAKGLCDDEGVAGTGQLALECRQKKTVCPLCEG